MSMRDVHPAEEHKKEAVGKLENYNAAELLKTRRKKSAGLYNSHYTAKSELMSTAHNPLKIMVDVTGIEPATPCLQIQKAKSAVVKAREKE
jgi:hypothetical protein